MEKPLLLNTENELFRWKVVARPAFIFASGYGMVKATKEEFGVGWPACELLFERMHCFWWNEWEQIIEVGKKLLEDHWDKQKEDYSAKFYDLYSDSIKQLLEECKTRD